jgi:peptidoglycan/xylan/chitin deacetylase (PgdA/CDA1 family)
MAPSIKKLALQVVDRTGNLLLRPPYGGASYFRNHGSRKERKVSLTFDDGPSKPSTEIVLDTLAELGVKATFFCVGINAKNHPDLVLRAYREGHAIGNHSMDHSRWSGLKLRDDGHIDDASREISSIIGQRPCLYRPPWGWLTPWEGRRLSSRGYTIVGWDVFTIDWQLPEPDGEEVAESAIRAAKSGSILLLHDGLPHAKSWTKTETVRTLRRLIPALRGDGYEFVTIPDLLCVPAYAPLGAAAAVA